MLLALVRYDLKLSTPNLTKPHLTTKPTRAVRFGAHLGVSSWSLHKGTSAGATDNGCVYRWGRLYQEEKIPTLAVRLTVVGIGETVTFPGRAAAATAQVAAASYIIRTDNESEPPTAIECQSSRRLQLVVTWVTDSFFLE